MAESDFMAAFNKRYSEGGFDPQYQRDVSKKVAALSQGAKDIASKKRPKLRQTGMGSFDPETGARASEEQLGAVKQFQDYDAMREELAGYLAGNVYDRGKRPDMEQARKIVDDFARAQREQQYSTSESAPVPAPVPAPTPTAASTPTMSEAESTGYAKLESAMFPEGVEVGTRPPETVKLESNMFPEGVEVAATAPSTTMAESPTPAAKPVIDEARMASLFRKTTGTNFNPKSRVDKERMAQLTSFVEQDTDMLNKSDTRIALDFYKTL